MCILGCYLILFESWWVIFYNPIDKLDQYFGEIIALKANGYSLVTGIFKLMVMFTSSVFIGFVEVELALMREFLDGIV